MGPSVTSSASPTSSQRGRAATGSSPRAARVPSATCIASGETSSGGFTHSPGEFARFNVPFVRRKRKGVGRRDEERERKKATAKKGRKAAKEPLADIPEDKEERGAEPVGAASSDDEDLFGDLE